MTGARRTGSQAVLGTGREDLHGHLEEFARYSAERREAAGFGPDHVTDVKRALREADPETVAESEAFVDSLLH